MIAPQPVLRTTFSPMNRREGEFSGRRSPFSPSKRGKVPEGRMRGGIQLPLLLVHMLLGFARVFGFDHELNVDGTGFFEGQGCLDHITLIE